MNAYAEFLATKARRHHGDGLDVDPADLHPSLHPWQSRVVVWAAAKGRAALFEDCGMGKTRQQVEWARLSADTSLIVAPLTVARQTVREAAAVDVEVRYVRRPTQVDGPGVYITNYEMAGAFAGCDFGAVVLDESSILKSIDGVTRRLLTEQFSGVPRRLACTATPAPNDVAEMCNHAEWLGVMPRAEMLAAYFVHDSDTGWRLKGHAADPMYRWMASWAVAARTPSDVGGDDTGYLLPPLTIIPAVVEATIQQDGQLFATDLGGVGGRARVRRATINERVARAVELVTDDDGQPWIVWCGLNDESEAVTRDIPGAVNVTGSMPPESKAEALEAFQDGDYPVLVTKPSVAGFGMNFQHCARMAFVGLSDSYESYYQAVRRCWRYGQTRPVEAHVVVSELEAQIVDNVRRKEAEAAQMTARLIAAMHWQEAA